MFRTCFVPFTGEPALSAVVRGLSISDPEPDEELDKLADQYEELDALSSFGTKLSLDPIEKYSFFELLVSLFISFSFLDFRLSISYLLDFSIYFRVSVSDNLSTSKSCKMN